MSTSFDVGLNLSFCVKRWSTSALWAPLIRNRFDVDLVQFSFDLVDPMWPGHVLDRHADQIRSDAANEGISIHSAFIGLGHYSFHQLLDPDWEVRDYAEQWLGKAYAFAARAGIRKVGGPLGGVVSPIEGLRATAIPELDYQDLVARMLRLADRAKSEGLDELYVEPTPMRREWPWTVEQALRLSDDVRSASLPWRYCLDWGHGTVEPLYGEGKASMQPWLEQLKDVVTAIHIQQTDYQLDRHWDFTQPGRVVLSEVARSLGECRLERAPVFLEVFYPFERDDQSVLDAVGKSVHILKLELH